MADIPENSAFHETTGIPLRQSLGGAVPDRKWLVAIVKRNYEEICRKRLQEQGFDAYVASQKTTHVYPNRHRREVTHLVIAGVVFIRLNETERLQVLKENPTIQYFLTNKASQPNIFGRHPFAVIPDYQMERLQFMLYHAEAPVNFTAEPLHLGDRIRVARGQLAGLEGCVTRRGNATYLVVTLDILGSAMVNIATEDLEKIA